MTNTRRYTMCALAAGALTVGAVGGPAAFADGDAAQAEPATISMRLLGNSLRFTGPDQVAAGQTLRIANRTKPRQFGPHTFTLTREGVIPGTRKERQNCFKPGNICRRVAVAHEVNFKSGKVGQRVVKVGARGWDREFTRRSRGDSWVTETLGDTLSQKVSAKPGTTLHYFCAIHPEMTGEIEVIAGP